MNHPMNQRLKQQSTTVWPAVDSNTDVSHVLTQTEQLMTATMHGRSVMLSGLAVSLKPLIHRVSIVLDRLWIAQFVGEENY